MYNSIPLKHAQTRRDKLLGVISEMKVHPGWIKYMRSILGLTLKELGKRAGLSTPGVANAERRENEGKITLEKLEKIANAMECELVYAFIPKDNISDLLRKKAIEKARKSILKADIHMSLEDQKVNEELELRIERLAEKLIKKGKVW